MKRNVLRSFMLIPAIGALMTAATAVDAAQTPPPSLIGDTPRQVRPSEGSIQLAQYREAEVYYDRNGNRVIVDSMTGEIIAVQPRGFEGRPARRERRDDRYYLDDPDDMARLRRDQMQERRLRALPPPDDFVYADPDYPRPDYDYVEPEYDYGRRGNGSDAFPEAPPRGTVERAPLDPAEPWIESPDQTTTITSPSELDSSEPTRPPALNFTAREDVAALQILLDRAGASPGVIDGKFGSNVDKALAAYREITGKNLRSTDTALIKSELQATGGDPFALYEITPTDAAGPFVASVPEDYGEKARLEHMSYTSVTEMLAERFHMDEGFLKALNPDANFSRPGTRVRVANFGQTVSKKVTRLVADKSQKQLLAYGEDGRLVAAYPATIGSSDTPSPTGIHNVSRVAFDPNYTYNPKVNFKQGNNHQILTIPPGPNGPVGSIWIALDKPTYGIHGTPEPSKIGKTESHGCVRLTNWDAQELAKLVSPGVPVEFIE
ncbi:L,D-transpeptidase family protein [Pseudaminobacter soli (ex Zhang et al. 2022)]|nr:L,D-transpeptidase [Pseudaminobacter soli]